MQQVPPADAENLDGPSMREPEGVGQAKRWNPPTSTGSLSPGIAFQSLRSPADVMLLREEWWRPSVIGSRSAPEATAVAQTTSRPAVPHVVEYRDWYRAVAPRVLAILLLTMVTACSTRPVSPAERAPTMTPAPVMSDVGFATAVSADGRSINDQHGRPWFGRGDTAWSLLGQLDLDDAMRYLDDRVGRGFNLVLATVPEPTYASNAPANAAGDPPFVDAPFRSAPNEAYWGHVDRIVAAARDRGVTLLLCPAYLDRTARTTDGQTRSKVRDPRTWLGTAPSSESATKDSPTSCG